VLQQPVGILRQRVLAQLLDARPEALIIPSMRIYKRQRIAENGPSLFEPRRFLLVAHGRGKSLDDTGDQEQAGGVPAGSVLPLLEGGKQVTKSCDQHKGDTDRKCGRANPLGSCLPAPALSDVARLLWRPLAIEVFDLIDEPSFPDQTELCTTCQRLQIRQETHRPRGFTNPSHIRLHELKVVLSYKRV